MGQNYRLSYSILNAWARGDYESAIAMVLRQPVPGTPAMEEGKRLHTLWELEGKKTNALPRVFGSLPLVHPQFEVKKEIALNDWITFVGRLDVLDIPKAIDYKSGVTPATAFANSPQHCCYQVLYPALKSFEYHCYNPSANEVTMVIVHLNDTTLQRGIEFILSNASEIRDYCEQNDIVPVAPLH
jgi:hypothetical protein